MRFYDWVCFCVHRGNGEVSVWRMSNFLEEQLKSATLEETPSFKVSGRHTEPSDHDYYILEHPINSEYTKQVFRTSFTFNKNYLEKT